MHGHLGASHPHSLAAFFSRTRRRVASFLGYQTSQQVRFEPRLHPLLDINLLNIGDAFVEGGFRVSAKEQERAVLDFYARHWRAPSADTPNTADSYWGYVTAMGSTEGNLFGLWNARDWLMGTRGWFDPDSDPGVRAKPPVLLASREAHYSIAKAARILGIALPSQCSLAESSELAPAFFDTDAGGAIDVDQLVRWAQRLFDRGHPLIFALTAGTTFRGGFDPIAALVARLPRVFLADGRRNYWIHVDAAICGNTLPWIEQLQSSGRWPGAQQEGGFPCFDFRIPQVSSICASPYKWIGAPWPFGIYLMRGNLRLQPPAHPSYLGAPDSTLCGSRSGLACVHAWHYFAHSGAGRSSRRGRHARGAGAVRARRACPTRRPAADR